MLPLHNVSFFSSPRSSPPPVRIHAQQDMKAEERVSVNETNGKRRTAGYLGEVHSSPAEHELVFDGWRFPGSRVVGRIQ